MKDVICGEIPDGFIICGWILKSNCNSKAYDVVGNWERNKEIQIIGEEYFKFKIDLTVDNDINEEEIEIDWILEIFCIHSDYLLKFSKKNSVKNNFKHYFINCDCNCDGYCFYYNPSSINQNPQSKPTKGPAPVVSGKKKNFGNLFG